MKKFFKNLMPMLLLVAGLGISPNLWAERWTEKCNIYYYSTDNAGNTHSDGWYNADGLDIKDNHNTIDIGTVTNFTLKKSWAKTHHSDNWGTTNMKWKYGIGNSDNEYKLGESWGWSSDQDRYFNFDTDVNYSVVGNAPNNPGQNTLYVYYILNFTATDGTSRTSKTLYVNFTIPGFSTSSASQTDYSTALNGDGQSKTISFTQHYGNALNTGNCELSGTDASDFQVTSISETGVTVKFKPTSTIGTKTATLTITDAHGKECTISLQGEAQDPLSTGVTLRGTFNSWSETANEFRRAAAGATTATTTLTLSAKQSERFLVYVDGDKYGNSGTLLSSTNSAWGFDKDGADCYFNTAGAGTYTFTWDITNKKLSVTYPEETHPSSNYVYFLDDNSWGTVSAHLYDTGDGDKITNWPGQPLRTVTIDGKTYYLCAVGAKQKVIFTDNTTSKRVPNSEPADATTGGAKYLNAKTTGKTWSAFEFAVTIDKNGGDANGSAVAKFGVNKFKSGNTFIQPTRTGYKITKYTLGAASSSAQFSTGSETATFAQNTTYTDASGNWNYNKSDGKLYAQWTAKTYTVEFDQTGCTESQYTSQDFTYDAALSTINSLHRPTPPTGYDYLGYSTKDGTNGDWGALLTDGTGHWNAVDGYTAQVGDNIVWKCELTKLYSKIAPQTYTITYKDQGDKTFSGDWGTTVHPTTHTYNTATTLVDAPDKTGYTFGGWYSEATCENKVTELGATAYTADITLYAKWIPTTTTITIDRQDGSATKEIVATYDGSISAVTGLADADYQRTGYTFNGMRTGTDKNSSQVIIRSNDAWAFLSSAGSGTYTNGATPPVWKYTPNTLTLYTRWDANNYNITFNQHEPTTAGDASATVTFDASVSKITAPQKTGKIFSGYYTEQDGAGVQIFDAGGNLVANAAGGDPSVTYTSDGKWKYAGDITLHAYWAAPAEQVVNFGITDGSALSNTLGTITAKVDGVAISSGDKVASGKEVVFEYSAAKGTVITTINGTKLKNWYNGVNTSTATPYGETGNSYSVTVSASTVNAYAYAQALEYTVATAVNPVGKGSVESNNEFRCGPNLNTTLTAVNPNGYDFVNWTADGESGKVQFTGETNVSPINVAVKEAGRTVTANFQIHNYTITYESVLTGSEHTNPATYTIETETITFTPATSILGHVFTGWSPASIALGSTGDKTITASYSAVSLAPVASANIIEGKQATITPNFTAPSGTYTYNYTCANISTFNVGANGVATFTAPAAGNYTITLNVYEGTGTEGVRLATTNIEITVNEDLSSNYYLEGNAPFGGWTKDGTMMTKKSGHKSDPVVYFTVSVPSDKLSPGDNEWGFKIYYDDGNEQKWYGWGSSSTGNYHITSVNHAVGLNANNDNKNLAFRPTVEGNYEFKLDYSGEYPYLTVTYPDESYHMVTIETEAGSNEVKVTEVTETALVADQYVNGLRFDRWVVTNSAGEDKSSSITINTPTSYSTHMKNATEDGLIVKATYTSHGMIYFKNNANWSGVNVYFYDDEYFDNSKGTGCIAKWKENDKDKEDRKATGYGMTNLKNTDIWYYNWIDNGLSPKSPYVAFSDKFQNDAQWFDQCQVTYRGDWHDEAPLFVIRNYINRYLNEHEGKSAAYYDEGLWMKYNSTESGYDIRGQWGSWAKSDNQYFTATTPGGYEFTSGPITLPGNTSDEQFIVYLAPKGILESYFAEYGTMIGKGNTITPSQPYTRVYDKKTLGMGNGYIQTTAGMDYIFKLSLGDGQIIVSVEYPLSQGDYQVVSVTEGKVHSNGIIYKQGAEASPASFFIEKGKTTALKLQKCSTIVDNKPVWENTSVTYDIPSTMETGIYNFSINPDATNPTIENLNQAYSGKYYIRTSGVDGGWESFSTNKDNEMTDYGSLLDAGITYNNFKYNYYKTKWIHKDANVKFCIANDYSKCLTDSLEDDDILGEDKQFLPQEANVRFMWNSTNNTLSRAYISGSTDITKRFLVLIGDEKMFDKNGNPLDITGLNPNEINFADNNNWVYQADIKAQPGCAVKLTAAYNSNVQYFIGAAGEEATSRKTIIDGTKASDTKYTMRVVYDFKTNRLVAGWMPSNTAITEDLILGGDMLISRTHQDDAQQIIFGTGGSIEQIHHVYGVLSIKKDTMLGNGIGDKAYTTIATNADYSRTMYWISFPFDVKISEIFGVDGYGQKWIIQKYRGDLRAQKGWFKGDGTETFWEFMDESETLNAYEGYLFLIDANYFNTDGADVWKNSATEANFYFPSASGNIGIINKSSYPQTVLPHECKIDRKFEVTDSEGHKTTVNHKNTDSHWNVIGVPAFQNASGSVVPAEGNTEFKAFYEWNSENNGYKVRTTANSYEFKTMHAYMTQFYGTINWSEVSVVNNPTEAQGGTAPRYAYADEKNYMIELFFNGNGAEDHTYIKLADEASTDFVLNEDMMKIDNAGFPNIYSFAGNYNVAYNETKKDNQTVMLGVSAPKDGNYTFAMPKDFSGTAKLIDLVEGITTDLNVANYSVDLNKGTYNNRFQLVLEVEAKTPTSMENVECGLWNVDGKTTKILRNGEIYLINGGRVYNVLGVEE